MITLGCLEIAFRSGKQTKSPWAVKKINSKCAKTQNTVYHERLCEEAKILKELQHPNIVGKYVFVANGLLGVRRSVSTMGFILAHAVPLTPLWLCAQTVLDKTVRNVRFLHYFLF